MIERDVFEILREELDKKEITAVVGARQIGKTTALEKIYSQVESDANFVSFEDKDILELFEENIKLFIEQHIIPYKYIFIDEFQYAKKGGQQLKLIYDTKWRKIFISGSSKPELAIHSLGYLVGRVSIIEMHPVSFKEFVKFKSPQKSILLNKERKVTELKQLNAEFEEFITFGGYPAVIIEKEFEKKQKILKDIIQTYLYREIKDILGYKENRIFERIIKRLAIQNGKLAKKSNIAQDLDATWNKIAECISILEKTGIIIEVKPFFTNKAKEIIKTPKIYFSDNGFINGILNNFSFTNIRSDKGEIYESYVVQELIKQEIEPKFWNKQQSEVDFIIEKDQKITAIEVKSKTNKIPKAMKLFSKEYQIKQGIIFNESTDKTEEVEKTTFEMKHIINVVNIKDTI